MNRKEFNEKYTKLLQHVKRFSELAHRNGILSLEKEIKEVSDTLYLDDLNIFRFGITFIVDGLALERIEKILTYQIKQVKGKEKILLMTIEKEAVLAIQRELDPEIVLAFLTNYADTSLAQKEENINTPEDNNKNSEDDEVECDTGYLDIVETLSDQEIQAIIQSPSLGALEPALIGASQNVRNAFYRNMSPYDVTKLKDGIEWMGELSDLGMILYSQKKLIKLIEEIKANPPKDRTTFNYLFSHKVLPNTIFNDLDNFYKNIINNLESLKLFLQNVLIATEDYAQKYAPDCELGFDIEQFTMAFIGDSPENSILVITIPYCFELNDCAIIAIPRLRDHASYFTCELSENPIDGSNMYIVGEWRPDGESLKHIYYGPLEVDNQEIFVHRVRKIVYGNVGDGQDRPAPTSEQTEYYQRYSSIFVKSWDAYTNKDYATALKLLNEAIAETDIYAIFYLIRSQVHKALGNNYMADYDIFQAKLINNNTIEKGKRIYSDLVEKLGFEPKEPLILKENHYDIIPNSDGDLVFCLQSRDGEPHMSSLYYSGGSKAQFCRRFGQYILLEDLPKTIKQQLPLKSKVLVAEFNPADEKRDYTNHKSIITEYEVNIRNLSPTIRMDYIVELCSRGCLQSPPSATMSPHDIYCGSYLLFAPLASLARQHIKEGRPITELVPSAELPTLAAIFACEEDYNSLGKYIAEGHPLNERCSKRFHEWQPTPLFFITTPDIWGSMEAPEKMLTYLVQNGADPNMSSGDGETPLSFHCYWFGKSEIIRALLKVGADANIGVVKDGDTYKPLLFLLYNAIISLQPLIEDTLESAKLLIEAGAGINNVVDSYCPLACVICYGRGSNRKELVQLLLSKGANVELAIECMETLGEIYRDYYHALYELYSGLPDLAEPLPELAKWYNLETAQYYKQLSTKKENAPVKKRHAEYTLPPQDAAPEDHSLGSIIDFSGRQWHFGGLQWRILEVKDGTALIISEQIIARRAFHRRYIDITWEECSLRDYLNREFYNNKFTLEEKARILETRNSNPPNPWYGTKGCADTIDKIFLLSIDEVVKYFGDSGDLKNKKRKNIDSQISDSYKNGIYEDPNGYYLIDKYNQARNATDAKGEESWELRTPGHKLSSVSGIYYKGFLSVGGSYVAGEGGVRPAMWIKI